MTCTKALVAGVVTLPALFIVLAGAPAAQQTRVRPQPLAVLETAPVIRFPAATDSNSPAYWLLHRGVKRLAVVNSSPEVVVSFGPDLTDLEATLLATFKTSSNGGRWIEAIVPDGGGRLYGYYHNEPAGVCDDPSKTAPRIGAARSFDGGRTWKDLGLILQASAAPFDCDSPNHYFAGGVGDFSVILNRSQTDLYFLFSTYSPSQMLQGVAVARMRWSDRNAPAGQVSVWDDGVWRYPEETDGGWAYPDATPILPARGSWHDPRGNVDAFWGPSVHWNTRLERYVMLLNRAKDADWSQEGIYISATRTIEDPGSWSTPQKLLDGGQWYPQVIGLEPGTGTDRLAGERARFFMGGVSTHEIVFQPPTGTAIPR